MEFRNYVQMIDDAMTRIKHPTVAEKATMLYLTDELGVETERLAINIGPGVYYGQGNQIYLIRDDKVSSHSINEMDNNKSLCTIYKKVILDEVTALTEPTMIALKKAGEVACRMFYFQKFALTTERMKNEYVKENKEKMDFFAKKVNQISTCCGHEIVSLKEESEIEY